MTTKTINEMITETVQGADQYGAYSCEHYAGV